MMMKKPAPSAPVMNHLRPLTRQPPAARTRAGGQRRRVRACPGRRLGHRERRAHVAARERLEILLLLLRVGHDGEQVHVSLIRCRDVHGCRAEQRVPRLLEDRSPVRHSQAVAPVGGRRVRREDPGIPGGLLQLDPQRFTARGGDVTVVRVLERQHRLTDEATGADSQVLHFGGIGQIDHCWSTPRS